MRIVSKDSHTIYICSGIALYPQFLNLEILTTKVKKIPKYKDMKGLVSKVNTLCRISSILLFYEYRGAGKDNSG